MISKLTVEKGERSQAIISLIAFISFICYGNYACSIGAALPEISKSLNVEETELSIIFSCRGFGFICGTLFYSLLLELKSIPPKEEIVSFSVLGGGLCAGILACFTSVNLLMSVVFIQAFLFSGIDIMCNTLLPNIWGVNVQPWLHALHACWSIGGILGPTLVGFLGYQQSYFYLMFGCTIPLLILVTKEYLLQDNCCLWYMAPPSVVMQLDDNDVEENVQKVVPEPTVEQFDAVGGLSMSIRVMFFLFMFLYVGLESGYGGWISSYAAHNTQITGTAAGGLDQTDNVAYLTTIFFFAMSVGRVASVPLAVYYAPSTLMKVHLSVTLAGSLLLCVIGMGQYGYIGCALGTAILGCGISAIFPIGLTLAHEYQLPMDDRSTTFYMLGSVSSESVLPMVMGMAMRAAEAGDRVLMFIIVFITCVLIVLYHIIAFLLSNSIRGTKAS